MHTLSSLLECTRSISVLHGIRNVSVNLQYQYGELVVGDLCYYSLSLFPAGITEVLQLVSSVSLPLGD